MPVLFYNSQFVDAQMRPMNFIVGEIRFTIFQCICSNCDRHYAAVQNRFYTIKQLVQNKIVIIYCFNYK